MSLSIIANLISAFSLLSLPILSTQVIETGYAEINQEVYLSKTLYQPNAPYRLNNNSLGIKITAQSALIVDQATGLALWQKRPAEQRSIASLTKLMTALVFLDHNPGWNESVKIIPDDYLEGGRIRVYSGEEITVRDLFNASLVASSNNATMALARSTGLSAEEFIWAMNDKAKALGMTGSNFAEPTGLDPANISTAEDLVKLAKEAFNRPEISQATIQKKYNLSVLNVDRNYTLENTDRLLNSYLKVRAGKTGYLDEAGYCLLSEIEGPAGQRLIVVVLGSSEELGRFQEVKALSQWAFDNYRWPKN